MDQKDLAWNLYCSEREFIRHHEEQRTHASSILGAVAAALVATGAADVADGPGQLLVGAIIVLVGAFGAVFCAKLTALIHMHQERSYGYLEAINSYIPDVDIKSIKTKADGVTKGKHPWAARITLNRIWLYLHCTIAAVGCIMIVIQLRAWV